MPHKVGAATRELDLNEVQAKTQASSWPGEEQCFLPMQESAVRSWERKHPGSVGWLQEDTLCVPAELCCPGGTWLQQEILQGLEVRKSVEEDEGLLFHAGFCTLGRIR